MKPTQAKDKEIVIDEFKTGIVDFWIKGVTPYIYNAMSEKAKHDLLFPPGKKTIADKQQNMKHDPLKEYQGSVYRKSDGIRGLGIPAIQVKAAIMNAALEIPGITKTQIGRLVWVNASDMITMYGIPKLKMDIVRSAGMDKVPDVRTRAIVPEWCCHVQLNYVRPTINETAIARLVSTAGLIIGIGDFRQEKGKGNYGQFRIVPEDECKELVKTGNEKAQVAALEKPSCYDVESENLLEWFVNEKVKRGR
jgi:hypothetical protein